MRVEKYGILTFVLILLTVIIHYTCKPTVNQAVGFSSTRIKVTDFRAKEITLEKPATRIICLIESALSGLYMLEAENLVIGVSTAIYNESVAEQYALLDERIKNKTLPAPGNWDFVSIENIVALQPDLVIIWASQTEAIDAIEEYGIPVYGVFLSSFNDVYKEIRDLGTLTGKSQKADSLITFTQNDINVIKQQSSQITEPRKKVYFMWAQGLLETAGTTSTVNELIELAGAKNCCPIQQEHVVINKEKLLDWNPDIIVLWYNPRMNPNDLYQMPELKSIKAIQNAQVYELPSVFFCDLWTLKFPYAVKMLAKWCYPATFESLKLEEEKRKMLIELYGKKGEKLLQ